MASTALNAIKKNAIKKRDDNFMMKINGEMKKSMLLVLGASLLSACAGTGPFSSTTRTSASLDAKNHYTARRNVVVGGVPFASTNNTCVDNFNFLKEQNDEGYPKYAQDYHQISKAYTFLNVNKNIMDKDARDVYTMNLDIKLDTLCSKFRYSGFRLVEEKMKALSGI